MLAGSRIGGGAVYDGLVASELLAHVPPTCECVYAGKKRAGDSAPLKQEEINALLIERARAGNQVVRLKGALVSAMNAGAADYLTTPLDMNELLLVLERAHDADQHVLRDGEQALYLQFRVHVGPR